MPCPWEKVLLVQLLVCFRKRSSLLQETSSFSKAAGLPAEREQEDNEGTQWKIRIISQKGLDQLIPEPGT